MPTVASRAVLMQHDKDPRKEILDAVKPYVSKIHMTFDNVVLATYVRPEKTRGGIILSSGEAGMRSEDVFQGKSHLIIAAGPSAFEDDEEVFWGDRRPVIGDWVMVRVSDGLMFKLGDTACRLLSSRRISMIVDEPDIIL